MPGWYVGRPVGRLIEGRPLELRTADEGRRYCDEFRAAILGRPGNVVICADYRAIPIFSPEVAAELKRLMADMNDRVERSAILVAPEHAVNALQVDRIVRDAHHPTRRRFTRLAELLDWLGEVLTPIERARAERFLAGR